MSPAVHEHNSEPQVRERHNRILQEGSCECLLPWDQFEDESWDEYPFYKCRLPAPRLAGIFHGTNFQFSQPNVLRGEASYS
jgi:hypothetical protein